MDYLPLFLRLVRTPVLVVGGGHVAQRKVSLLCRAGAVVTVVAPEIEPDLHTLLEQHGGHWLERAYSNECIKDQQLVIVATPDRELNRQVSLFAQERMIPVNVVDDPELCSFIFPAIVDRSPLLVAIGSGGRSPVLVRRVRSQIESLLPAEFGKLAEFAAVFRRRVAEALADISQRRRFWETLLDRPALQQRVFNNDNAGAGDVLENLLAQFQVSRPSGEVYLLGAGPGDPDLVTFKTLRLLQAADVVLYDRLVSPQVLDLSRRDAERIYVGKQRSDHAVPQQEINQMLVDLALQGKRVARLKGGDPFIFGRGGEEIELLAHHQIPFQVVPGITAASGCACYAGIPLTHRDHAQSVRFITGHLQDGSLDLPWQELQNPRETLVFYMGLQGIGEICLRLQEHGRAAETAVALVEQGTTANQRTHVSTLAELPALLANTEIHPPTIIIVGSVVGLREKLQWYSESTEAESWPPTHGVV
jgi:uroporphyrin-III C-methyltransferase / precorrin-2 dehydrogenase / sirohydrochlorin ferrochelatase